MPEWRQEILRRLAGLRLAPTPEAEIVEELAQHVDDRYQELRGSGVAEALALETTLAEIADGTTLIRELQRVELRAEQEAIVLGTRE